MSKKHLINITKNAWNKIHSILELQNAKGMLFTAESGGCNGFNFDLRLIHEKELEKLKKSKPTMMEHKDVKLYIEPISEMHLFGTTIDFIDEDYSKGIFESKFTYNVDKELASSCGCGVSFMPRNI